MRILRLRKNQKLAISVVFLITIIGVVVFTVTNYGIDTAAIQRTLKLENFVNLSNNQTHDPTPLLGADNDNYKLNTNPVEFTPNKFASEPSKADALIEQIYSFKKFLNDEILQPIIAEDGTIKKISALSKDSHYADNKKKPHLAGPVKENYREDPVYTKDFLLRYLRLTSQELSTLKKSHSNMVKSLPKEFPPEVVESTFKDSQGKPTNGYVYVGGSQFNFLTLLSIKSLRASGSVLPVEVVMPKHLEFDIELCNYIFPKLNAKCIIMEDFIGKKIKKRIDKYQLKSMAILVSSFQNVLFLDSDNMVIENPDYLFFNEPFQSYGMVNWPDLWRRSTSPFWYSIANVDVNENKKVRNSYWHNFFQLKEPVPRDGDEGYGYDWTYSYHDFQGTIPETSSESGQIMINKEKYARTLFLSIYYNFYGPDYYYPLLTQNSHGEGDKETYIAAAHALGQKYYQVEEFARDFQLDNNRNRQGKSRQIHAVGQHNPTQEYDLKRNINGKTPRVPFENYRYATDKSHWEYKIWPQSKLLFLHCNGPKLYTWELMKGSLTSMGKRARLYGGLISELNPIPKNDGSIQELRDFELELFEHMKWYFCDHKDIKIKGLPSLDFDKICTELKSHIDFLKRTKN